MRRNLATRVKKIEQRRPLRGPVYCVHYLNAPFEGDPVPAFDCVCDQARRAGRPVEVIMIEYVSGGGEL